MENTIKINTDGGARGNPGPAAAAFVATDKEGKILASDKKFIGEATNNYAEYQGVLLALNWLVKYSEKNSASSVLFRLDSELVTKQLNGEYAVKHPDLKILFQESKKIIKALPFSVIFSHVRRAENKEADQLVNDALDARTV